MSFGEHWENALQKTHIVRSRVRGLETFSETGLPYVLLSESLVNMGSTVKRSGEISIQRPSVILPGAQFEGFDFKESQAFNPSMFTNMLLVRGVTLPSLRYANREVQLNVVSKRLSQATQEALQSLERHEDVTTTLLTGPDHSWQLSLLIFVAGQVARSAEGDVRKLFENYHNKKWF